MRSAADVGMPNSGASWRIVKSVRQYAVASGVQSTGSRLHGLPQRVASDPSRRSAPSPVS